MRVCVWGGRLTATRRSVSAPERLYRVVLAAIEGGGIPRMVDADSSTLMRLTLYGRAPAFPVCISRMHFPYAFPVSRMGRPVRHMRTPYASRDRVHAHMAFPS